MTDIFQSAVNQRGLAYYQKRTDEAFKNGVVIKQHIEVINETPYQVYKYYLPTNLARKVKYVRKYFQYLDKKDIPQERKRRKCSHEYAETAFMILSRFNHSMTKNIPIVAGSGYVCALPWACFGHSTRNAKNYFESISDLGRHYVNYMHGKYYPVDIHFKCMDHLPIRLAKKYQQKPFCSPNYWMAVALALTYDILHNCGPDCNEVFDLFSNDLKENPNNFDKAEWNFLRCKILGIAAPRNVLGPRLVAGFPTRIVERKPTKMKAEIQEISDCNDIIIGEKTTPLKKPLLALPPVGGFSNTIYPDIADYCGRYGDDDAEDELRHWNSLMI